MGRRQKQVSGKKKTNNSDISFSVDPFDIIYGKKIIIENSKLVIEQGQHYALIGKNGIGKTSILSAIANKDRIPPDLDIIYVQQEEPESDNTALEVLMLSDKMLCDKQKRLDELELCLSIDENAGILLEEYTSLGEEIGTEYDKRVSEAKRILVGLGFSSVDHNKPIRQFSGGWRMRLSIAKSLFMTPNLLMLDEPTNHLDFAAVFWLKSYLKKYPKTLIVVSHDRYFIDEVCTCIMTIKDKQLRYYGGNYSNYEKRLDLEILKQQKDWDLYNKRLTTMKKTKTPKEVDDFIRKSRIARPEREYIVKISFIQPSVIKTDLISLEDVSFSFNAHPDNILSGINLVISPTTRMIITGDNGTGKSTLLRLIGGDLPPTTGVITTYRDLRIGFYHQHFETSLPFNLNPVQYLMMLNENIELTLAHKYLSMFGLEPINHKTLIGNLSGGQKARVKFASFGVTRPHILLLDEPTNHLDIVAIQSLITALNNFEGAIVLITHNLDIITTLDCEIWTVANNHLNKQSPDYIDYIESLYDQE